MGPNYIKIFSIIAHKLENFYMPLFTFGLFSRQKPAGSSWNIFRSGHPSAQNSPVVFRPSQMKN